MSPTRSTLLLGALALASASAAQDRGKLLGIKAAGDARASVVLISADRPLSFTTMKLSDPPRVVVDFADTEIAFTPRELAVEDGTVRRVAAAPAGSRTARVVVELQADAEFDVRTAKNQVQLRIARRPPLVAENKPALLPQEQAPAANEPAPPEPRQDAAPDAPPPPAPAGQAAAAPKPTPEPTSPAPATGTSVRPPAPPVETQSTPPAASPPAQSAKPQTQTQTRTEAAPEATSATPDKTPAKTPPAEAAKIASLPKVSLVGSAPAASPPAKPRRAHANITGLGFRPVGAGEVIVRSDHPLAYGITADERGVLLHLPGARIPLPNNRRPLDTRFFDGAVRRVVPLSVAGGTDVRIELREPAEYKLEQSGAVLTVTFSGSR